MSQPTFAILIQCVDGRIQLVGNRWVQKNLGVQFVDTLTYPGPEKCIAEGEAVAMDHLRDTLSFLRSAHGSEQLVIAAHESCAGNPTERANQEAALKEAAKRLTEWQVMEKIHMLYVELNGTCHVVE